MRRLPLWIRSAVRCQPQANDADLYLPLQQDFAELLSRQLPDDAFHLQIKERSQNFGRIQAGAFHNIINVHRLLGAEQLVELFLRAIQCGGVRRRANRFRCSASGRSACRRAARMGVGSSSITSSAQVASFAPCLMSWFGAKLTGCVTFSRHAEDFSAELHGQARGDQRPAVLRTFHYDHS